MMTKKELISEVAGKVDMTKIDTEKIVNAVFDTIKETVASGDNVFIVNFGKFGKKHRNARQGRDPRNGNPIEIKAIDVPVFKASQEFKNLCE